MSVQNEILDPRHLDNLLMYGQWGASSLAGAQNWMEDVIGNSLPGHEPFPVTVTLRCRDGTTFETSGYYEHGGLPIPGDTPSAEAPVWLRSTVASYIGMPERFREYWRQVRDGLVALEGTRLIRDSLTLNSYTRTWTYSKLWRTLTCASGTAEPSWSGSWPDGYFHTTLPQLSGAFYDLLAGTRAEETSVATFYVSYPPPIGMIEWVSASNATNGTNFIRGRVYNDTDAPISVPCSFSLELTPMGTPYPPEGSYAQMSAYKVLSVSLYLDNVLIETSDNSMYLDSSQGDSYAAILAFAGASRSHAYSTSVTVPAHGSVYVELRFGFAAAISVWFPSPDPWLCTTLSPAMSQADVAVSIGSLAAEYTLYATS